MTLDRYLVHARDNFTCPTLEAIVTPVAPGCAPSIVDPIAHVTDDIIAPFAAREIQRASGLGDTALLIVFGDHTTRVDATATGAAALVAVACSSQDVGGAVTRSAWHAGNQTASALAGEGAAGDPPPLRCAAVAAEGCAPDAVEAGGARACACPGGTTWCFSARRALE